MASIQFFGYGLLIDRTVLQEIIGHDPGVAKSALVEGYSLTYQTIEQIPEIIRPVLMRVWGDSFRAYTLKKGKGFVRGVIWNLSEEEFEKIKKWECIGTWREQKNIKTYTAQGDTIEAETILAIEDQPVKEIVDGINYERHLNPKGKMLEAKINEQKFIDKEMLNLIRRQLSEVGEARGPSYA